MTKGTKGTFDLFVTPGAFLRPFDVTSLPQEFKVPLSRSGDCRL